MTGGVPPSPSNIGTPSEPTADMSKDVEFVARALARAAELDETKNKRDRSAVRATWAAAVAAMFSFVAAGISAYLGYRLEQATYLSPIFALQYQGLNQFLSSGKDVLDNFVQFLEQERKYGVVPANYDLSQLTTEMEDFRQAQRNLVVILPESLREMMVATVNSSASTYATIKYLIEHPDDQRKTDYLIEMKEHNGNLSRDLNSIGACVTETFTRSEIIEAASIDPCLRNQKKARSQQS